MRTLVARAVLFACLAVAAGSLTETPLLAQTAPVRLKARKFVPAANVHVPRSDFRRNAQSRLSAPSVRHLLIQFSSAITTVDLAALRSAGAVPLRYVPDDTVAVLASASFDPERVPRARWVGELMPADKISADSAADLARDFPAYPLTAIEFHPDLAHDDVVTRLSAAGVAEVPTAHLPAYMALISTDPTAVRALAEDDTVAWVYPATADLIASGALICEGLVNTAGPLANYATYGDGWDGPGRGSADLSYSLLAGVSTISPSRQTAEIARALGEWARYVKVRWHPALQPDEQRGVTVLWGPRDHGDGFPFDAGVLAHAFYPVPANPEPLAGDIHFNNRFRWGISDPSQFDIFSVALHEAGHSLGLAHSSNPSSVMYALYRGIVSGLASEDIGAIQSLYAAASSGVLPDGWTDVAVGDGVDGGVIEDGGTFTIAASGRDVWDRADELRFVSRTLHGDGDVVARVDSLDAVDRWSKAGIMIRGGTGAGAPHAFVLVSGGKGLAFQRRAARDALSTSTSGGAGTAPRWLWLSRRGNLIEAYSAVDGGAWRLIGRDTIALSTEVLAGLAVSGHAAALDSSATAVFSNVTIGAAASWSGSDVGVVGARGSWRVSGAGITVAGAGADVWGSADAFHYLWRPLAGDGDITARVSGIQPTNPWSKAGVMIRETLAPGSPHAFMLVSAGKGYAFQRRGAARGLSESTFAGSGAAPQWVKLSRRGDTLTAFRSDDGVKWVRVGRATIRMGRGVLVGLAVSSHVTRAISEAVFEDVQVK